MPDAIVTGACGFLGSHVVKRLLKEGSRVVGIDDLSAKTEIDPTLWTRHGKGETVFEPADLLDSTARLIIPMQEGESVLLRGKVRDFSSLTSNCYKLRFFSNQFKPSEIWHFAMIASPPKYKAQPIHTLRTGAEDTLIALELAKLHNARFLLASSSEVYGNPQKHPQPEWYFGNVDCTGPRSMYDEAKRYAEALTFAHHREFKTDIRVPRIFNTFGPGMNLEDGRMIPNFILEILSGRAPVVHGGGSQTRSLCYIDDLINGLFLMMRSNDERAIGPINLGNNEEVSVLEIANEVVSAARQLGVSCGDPIYKEQPCSHDPVRRCPGLTRAAKILGYHAHVPWKEGIKRTLVWAQKKLRS